MKKLFKVALVAVCMVFMGNFAKAQVKIGYIDQNALIGVMPELATVKVQMEAFQKTFVDGYAVLNKELNDKGQDYQSHQATMNDAQKTIKQSELADLQKRMQDFQTSAQQKIEAKSQEYMKPLYDRVHAAIDAIAKEKGYTYVLDSSQTSLLVSPPADDMMVAVKAKMGIK